MGGMTQQLENVQNQSQRKDCECSKLQEKSQQLQNEVDEMRRQKAIVERQLRQMEQQLLWERNRVEAQNQRLWEMEQKLAQSEKSSYDWIISRNEVQVTDKSLGSGGWGMVFEGRYCGCAVAVKQIHEDFAPACSLKMFQREIDMAGSIYSVGCDVSSRIVSKQGLRRDQVWKRSFSNEKNYSKIVDLSFVSVR